MDFLNMQKHERGTVLITGANGRIGTEVMRLLRERFETVIGFDRTAPTSPPPGCTRIPVDTSSDESLQEGLRILRDHHGSHIATVVHLAAYYDFSGEPSDKYEQVTVEGTRRLLLGLRQDFEVEQFIFSSTMLVHKPGEPGLFINEDFPIEPTWAYPESKAKTEAVIRAERAGIPAVILRIAGVYDDLCNSPPLAHQIKRIYERDLASRLYSGPTSHGQSFLHLDDLVEAILLTVERRSELPDELAVLLGEPEALSYDELQHTLQRLIHGESWETMNVPGPLAKAGAWLEDQMPGRDEFIKPWMIDRANDHYALDISRACKLLGWKPKHSLRNTLPLMVNALKADPIAWYRQNGLEPSPALMSTVEPSEQDNEKLQDVANNHGSQGGQEQPSHGSHSHAAMQAEVTARDLEPVSQRTDSMDMMQAHHQEMLWPHHLNIMLGLWLITSPFSLGYLSAFVPDANILMVTAERALAPVEARNLAMTWSDMISGILVVIFSALSADPSRRFPWAQWATATVGIWLLFAPLIFWAPLPGAYASGTLLGSLVFAFSVLVPMMPGMSMAGMMGGPDIPPGWAYTPSSWLQRMPIAVFAIIGFFIARHMTAYQLGYIDHAWDPFFGTGTEMIVTSEESKAWPVADAGLGAAVYMLELLMTFMGGKQRWRTMPWMVLALAFLILPLGIVSIFFIIIQPIVIGTWCTLCLIAALSMLLMIPYSLDEFVAMGQFLLDARRKGKPLWRVFWMGDAMEGGSPDTSQGPMGPLRDQIRKASAGVTFPIALMLSVLIGIWLMLTRLSLGSSGEFANNDHLIGALVVTFTIIAFAEVARAVRFINILFGAWLVASPWVLAGPTSSFVTINSVVCGLFLIGLALPSGPVKQSYAGWDKYVV